jgi:hypothetical protein
VDYATVNIRKPDSPVFKWSFSGHFLSPYFECFGRHFAFENRTIGPVFKWSAIFLPFENWTKHFLIVSLDRFWN